MQPLVNFSRAYVHAGSTRQETLFVQEMFGEGKHVGMGGELPENSVFGQQVVHAFSGETLSSISSRLHIELFFEVRY